ncbi:sigma factor-like helix-turn-helix DNA-binding protein [Lysinibacillus parviboronicapiens]|uniref:sigma factor-like helix-turn-helix DNA-binding protein n=1 Tax=Lysinibacillus parviboronicapiens TaxID=436516 RepID=UPI000D3689AA|nr:sigma factor-like helix-turn-helix DNA-binding protein [Lysinibacillus parviboronicapiens]
MEIMKNYADLLRIIDIVKAEIEMLEVDKEYWIGKDEHLPFFSTGARKYGLDIASQRTDRLNKRIASLETKLEHYQAIEKEIRENVEKLEGLEYRIAKLRFIDGMTYQEIADELGYSHDHIRRVASKSKKKEASFI